MSIGQKYDRYKVNEVAESRLRITGGGVSGWVGREDVVEFTKAIDVFTKLIEKEPTKAELYWYRGRIWLDKSDNANALADLNESIRLNPTNAMPYVGRAVVRMQNKELDEASADIEKRASG